MSDEEFYLYCTECGFPRSECECHNEPDESFE